MYFKGQGVQQDYAAAASWYGRAAEQGDAKAQYNLGVMSGEGRGVPQDFVAAVNWYKKAAEQGDAGAQFNLGVMYFKGQGVQEDYVHAHKWLNLSAVGGNEENIRTRNLVAARMTPQQIAEAQRLAREWRRK